MCGIAGVVSSYLTDAEKAAFCDLLRVNTLRGSHSTGIMAAFRFGKNVDYMVGKTTRNAVSALDTPPAEIKAIFDRKDSCTALIGHTRAATKGSIKAGNAHPFIFPRVIGVHNGTINTDLIYQKEFETDSEALYKDINERGLTAALKEINKGYPNYALVMFDREHDNLLVIRNARRPLHFTFNKSNNTLFFSSEAGALRYVLARHNLTYKEQVFPLLKEDVAMTMPISYECLSEMSFDQMDVKPKTVVHHVNNKSTAPASGVWPSNKTETKASVPPVTLATSAAPQREQVNTTASMVAKKNEPEPKKEGYSAPAGMSKSAKKKFQKALRKQAKVSAMLAKQKEDDDDKESDRPGAKTAAQGFTPSDTPAFLKQAGIKATSKRIRKFFKTTPITEDNKSPVLHQSALFDDVADKDIALAELDRMDKEADLEAGITDPPIRPDPVARPPLSAPIREHPDVEDAKGRPFDDPLPWEDDPEDGDADPNAGYIGASGEIFTREQMEDMLNNGCSWCSQHEHLEFHERVEWIDRDQYICAECMDTDPFVLEYFGKSSPKSAPPRIH